MEAKNKLDAVAAPDHEWIKEAEFRQENRYWMQVSLGIAIAVLRTLRKTGMTQREFARELGCSPQYVSKILKGSENLTLETICKMEKVLQIKLIETPLGSFAETNSFSQQAQ